MEGQHFEGSADGAGLSRRKLRMDRGVASDDAGQLPAGSFLPLLVLGERCVNRLFELSSESLGRRRDLTERTGLLANGRFQLRQRRAFEPHEWFRVGQWNSADASAAGAVGVGRGLLLYGGA